MQGLSLTAKVYILYIFKEVNFFNPIPVTPLSVKVMTTSSRKTPCVCVYVCMHVCM